MNWDRGRQKEGQRFQQSRKTTLIETLMFCHDASIHAPQFLSDSLGHLQAVSLQLEACVPALTLVLFLVVVLRSTFSHGARDRFAVALRQGVVAAQSGYDRARVRQEHRYCPHVDVNVSHQRLETERSATEGHRGALARRFFALHWPTDARYMIYSTFYQGRSSIFSGNPRDLSGPAKLKKTVPPLFWTVLDPMP